MDTVSARADKYAMADGQPYNERRRQARHSRTALVGGVVVRERDRQSGERREIECVCACVCECVCFEVSKERERERCVCSCAHVLEERVAKSCQSVLGWSPIEKGNQVQLYHR